MIFNNYKDKEWCIEHADGRPAFFEMTMIGFTKPLYNDKLPSYETGISHFVDGEVDYISLIDNQNDIGRVVIEEYVSDKKFFEKLYKKWNVNFSSLMAEYYQLYKTDFSVLSDNELITKSNYIYDLYANKTSMPGFIDGFMFYAEKRFNDLFDEFCGKRSVKDKNKLFTILKLPTSGSFLNEEEIDIRSIYKNKENIGKHLVEYSWIRSSYAGFNEYVYEDLIEEIKKTIGKKKQKNNFQFNKELKERTIKELDFNKELTAIIELSDLLIKWQDQRKHYSLTYVALKNKILQEISWRIEVDFDLLSYSLNFELEKIIKNEFNINNLVERRKSVLFVHENGLLKEILTGEKVIDFMEQISLNDNIDVKEIKGTIASLGRVRGKVKIVRSIKYIDKVEDGDILVAPMTRPEYLSGLKKAAAIVTDDGGITCHAAIVSRELKIPCIIGAKVATQVLKDGDEVEVDAEKGIVKIINVKK